MLGERELEFVDCPECGFPALVEHRFAVRSTDGPVPHLVTMCVQLHRLCTPDPLAVADLRILPVEPAPADGAPAAPGTPRACEGSTGHDAGTQ
jgi:hypothetical protein